ncbi:MAG: FixH family protein [Gemmatimonadaceae bacterium]
MKPGSAWPIGVSVILGVTVIGNLAVMRIANSDPSFAIESDYYQKAVNFDSTISLERKSATLGWTTVSNIAFDSSATTTRLTVSIVDKAHQPVTGLTVNVDALFNARANEIQHLRLPETSPGVYSAPIGVGHAGEWEVRINATRREPTTETTTFFATDRIVVPDGFIKVAPTVPPNR